MTEESAAPQHDDEFTPITSQEQLTRIIGERIGKVRSQFADYDDMKAKAGKLDALEQANKSEIEKLAEERDAEKARADATSNELTRLFVAHNLGLTPAQAKRLVGTTKEELEADAAEILRDFPAAATGQPRPASRPGALRSGSSGSPDTGEKGRAAAAVRALRQG